MPPSGGRHCKAEARPSKPTSISVCSTSTKTAKKTANNAITSASPNACTANNIGDGDTHGNHILTRTECIDGPFNELPVKKGGGVVPTSNHDKGRLLAKMKLKDLTKQEKELKGEFQNIMRRIFKDLTRIRVTWKRFADPIPLPDPLEPGADARLDDSGMELMTPDFTEDMGHRTNSAILSKTADLTVHEINYNPPDIVLKLYSSILFKCALLYEFAKTTFWGYVMKYQAQTDNTKKRIEETNWKVARHRHRREDVIPQFVANYGFNPSVIFDVDWMSDEDSEPKGISKYETAHEKQEAMTVWRTSCLHRLGITGDIGLHDDLALLEVIRPELCNKYGSSLLHELSCIYYLSLSSAERQSSKYKPWWFEMKEGKHGEYVQSWSSFDNPPDFDEFKEIKIVQVLKEVSNGDDHEEEDNDGENVDD
ncbi:hypothetical protein JB92DRAFT_3131816 [Gautieria morchelliformis]|nr:hypothetical protein JB92DRAFT_3131816 [Gautieria morchelliformis]